MMRASRRDRVAGRRVNSFTGCSVRWLRERRRWHRHRLPPRRAGSERYIRVDDVDGEYVARLYRAAGDRRRTSPMSCELFLHLAAIRYSCRCRLRRTTECMTLAVEAPEATGIGPVPHRQPARRSGGCRNNVPRGQASCRPFTTRPRPSESKRPQQLRPGEPR